MRYTILFSIFLISILAGCSKDKFGTTPTLKFKDVNTREIRSGNLLVFTLTFTDAEGDISDSLYVETIVPNCKASEFSQSFPVPVSPTTKNDKGDLTVIFRYNGSDPSYSNISPQCQMNDTTVFRFALTDKASHTSDTISSPPIVFIYQ
jgi:hypothetical protein